MMISRFCRNFIPTALHSIPSRRFAHKPIFGPPTQKISQMFREIKERQLAKILCENDLQPSSVLAANFCYEIITLEKASKMKLHTSIRAIA
jgi:hypothetical protein